MSNRAKGWNKKNHNRQRRYAKEAGMVMIPTLFEEKYDNYMIQYVLNRIKARKKASA